MPLAHLGWDDAWADALATSHPEVPAEHVGRVARVDMGSCLVLGPAPAPRRAAFPRTLEVAVGDWAVLDGPGPDPAVVGVLPRRTLFARAASGTETKRQLVAANIDTVFIVNALDARLSLRRIERYLALGWQAGAAPVVVLTKADLCDPADVDEAVAEAERVALGVPVVVTAAADDLAGVAAHAPPGRTVALLGLSGAGKSTLVNRLAGSDVAAIGDVRGDGKGRHTTTHRELFALPSGALVIDTPGMRELALWGADEGVEKVFEDVAAAAARCRFSDCAHESEPGCEVRAAVDEGRLDADRLRSWQKLQRELAHVERRQRQRSRRMG